MKQRPPKSGKKPFRPKNGKEGGARPQGRPEPRGGRAGKSAAEAGSGERRAPKSAAPRREGRAEQGGGNRLKIDLFGAHAVTEAWKNPKRFIHALYITEAALADFPIKAAPKRPNPTIVSKEQLDKSLPFGTVHQGIALSCQPLDEVSVSDLIVAGKDKPKSVLVMLDQVTDPHNVGAIARSASAFGADGMIMQRRHAPEPTGILAKIACGAVDHLPLAYETNLARTLETLKDAGYTAIGLDEHSPKTFDSLPDYGKVVLVLGNEGDGMRRLVKEHCDVLVTLPTGGAIASLNVSNAAAVALYALTPHKRK